jgi:hypothetical protein
MATVGQLNINGEGTIGNLLINRKLSVPFYQRSYSWQEKQVSEFFHDLDYSIRHHEAEYFLGSLVMTQSDDAQPADVVDGQQRIATAMILLAAWRDYFHSVSDTDRVVDFENTFLLEKEFQTQTTIPKLKLNDVDRDYFDRRVLERPDSAKRKTATEAKLVKDSHKLIKAASEFLAERVKEKVGLCHGDNTKIIETAGKWRNFMINGARVIWVTVRNESSAYVMFETLNDRGLELSKADLIKNFLLSKSKTRVHEVLNRWVSMQSSLEVGGEEEDLIVTFIRHYWSSVHGATRERELYEEIKKDIKDDAPKAFELADNLSDDATRYAAIRSASLTFWDDYGDASKSVYTLNQFQLKQIRPLLLAILSKMKKKQHVERCLMLLVRCSVRLLIFGGLRGGRIEEEYTKAAVQIRENKIRNATELLAALRKVVPNDAQFKTAFANASVSKAYLGRYYLRAIERYLQHDDEPEWIPNDEKAITLEHILPENPSSDWKLSDEIVEANYKKIGNLTLLKKRINNKDVANGIIAIKAPFYEKSEYELTKKLKNFTTWGAEEIAKRGNDLAELAIKTWPLKV